MKPINLHDPMRRLLIVLSLAVSVPLSAQAPATSAPRDGIMAQFENIAGQFGGNLLAAFETIPAEQYGFHPRPAQQSVGYIAQHLVAANYSLCSRIGHLPRPTMERDALSDSVKARWPKDTLVARLRASFGFCDSALARVKTLDNGAQARNLLLFETDLAEHYSQLSGYMRQLDLVPPTARPPKPRSAIDLPASALAAFVGSYALDEERQLEVTLRDGALYAQSTGGETLRLWPESPRDFFLRERDIQVTFVRDARGSVTGLVAHQNGRDQFAPKIR